MKKLNFWLLASFFVAAFALSACGDDDETQDPNNHTVTGGDAVTVNDLIGTWTTNSTDNSYVVTFTANEVTITENGQQTFSGNYAVENGVVKYAGNMESVPGLLYNKSVLVIKDVYTDERGRQENLGVILFKQGKQVVTPKADIQGQWCWYSEFIDEEIIRTAIKFEGDNFELIITPWGERYVGTYVYEAGIIKLTVTAGYTSREEGTGYGELWGRMDPKTLECDDWRTLNQDHWHVDAVSHTPFIANGDEAYGFIANLPALLQKKK